MIRLMAQPGWAQTVGRLMRQARAEEAAGNKLAAKKYRRDAKRITNENVRGAGR